MLTSFFVVGFVVAHYRDNDDKIETAIFPINLYNDFLTVCCRLISAFRGEKVVGNS